MQPQTVGRYRILRELGRGGMGTVYLAYDPELDRHVAIKGLGAGQATAERRQRLRREARAAAALIHPNIAQVYDVLSEGEKDYVVMELVEGKSLAENLVTGPLSPAEVARLGAQVAEALAFAHRKGIIHRDIKSENIMLTPDGKVKVLDFGLAHILTLPPDQRLTQEGLVVGTSRAMSPEQAMGKPLDARSDIFSLGSLLYEAACGEPAFAGETVLETMHKVVRAEFVPLRQKAPHVPKQLAEVIERCLARDPADRFQNAMEVARLLDVGSRTFGTLQLAPVAGPTALVQRLVQRLPWVLAGVALLAVLSALVAWLGWLAPRKPLMVAVLPVSGALPASSPLAGTAVAEALTGFLANLEGVHVVAGREVRAVYREQASVRELAAALGVEEVVEAVALPANQVESLRLELRRVEGSTGRIRWSRQLEVGSQDLSVLQDRLTTALADGFRSFASRRRLRPPPREALEAYLEAKSRLDAGRASTGYREELALLARVEELAPDFAEAFLAHASIERFLAGNTGDPQRFARAEELLARAAKADPDHPELPLRKAQLARARGDEEEAVAMLRQLTQRRPGDPAAWAALGAALSRLGQVAESEKAFARALSLQPAITIWDSLSSARADRGDFAGARTAAEEILRRAPEHPLGLFRLAYVAGLVGDFAACEGLYARLYPQTRSLLDLLNWGTCAFYGDKLEQAEKLYRLALERAPSDPRPWANLADTYLWQGRQKEAREHYARALELLAQRLVPTHSALHPHILAHLGRLEEAVIKAQEAVAAAPNRNWNLFVAAEVAALAGDKVSMLAFAKRALALAAPKAWFNGPEFAPYWSLPEFQALFAGPPQGGSP